MRANLPIGSSSATGPNGNWFARLAVATSRISGRPATFLLAVAVVVVWAITGPLFGFNDTWQLVKYRHDDRDFPDGLSHAGYAKSRHLSATTQTRRADYGDEKCEEPNRRHRRRVR